MPTPSQRPRRLPPYKTSPDYGENGPTSDGYHDLDDDMAYMGHNVRREMETCIEDRFAKERDNTRPSSTKRLSQHILGVPSMDSDILKDRVKQREVAEVANFAEHDREARKY